MTLLRAVSVATPLALAPLTASAVVINFDVDGLGSPIAANTPITTQHSNLGVLFVGIENGNPVNVNPAPDLNGGPVPSAPNAMSNCDNATLFCPGNRADLVQVLFSSSASGISLQLNSLGGFLTRQPGVEAEAGA